MKKIYFVLTLLLIIIFAIVYFSPFATKNKPKELFNNDLHTQIKLNIQTRNLPYPLPSLQLLLFKKEQKLELWTTTDTSKNYIETFDISIENAEAGTRLYNNETIFPEGEYKLKWNSNKKIELIFPNEFDVLKASTDQRPSLKASFIFATSKGQDTVTLNHNDLNTLKLYIQDTRIEQVTLYNFPSDNRNELPFKGCNHCPYWITELYLQLDLVLSTFKKESL